MKRNRVFIFLFWILALQMSACRMQTAVDCVYVSADSVTEEFSRFENCAQISASGELHIDVFHLQRMRFVAQGLAQVWVDEQVFYVNSQGRSAPMLVFDNGADYFAEGLARTFYQGKVGFVDKQLNRVIPAHYDFAFPFRNGLAQVCIGCKRVAEGEHRRLQGGRWGYIDRTGNEVVVLKYSLENLPTVDTR